MSRNSYLGAQPQSSQPLGVQPVHRHSAHPVHNAQCTTIILLTTRCTARCTNTRQCTQHHSLVPAIWGLHSAHTVHNYNPPKWMLGAVHTRWKCATILQSLLLQNTLITAILGTANILHIAHCTMHNARLHKHNPLDCYMCSAQLSCTDTQTRTTKMKLHPCHLHLTAMHCRRLTHSRILLTCSNIRRYYPCKIHHHIWVGRLGSRFGANPIILNNIRCACFG